MTQEGTGVRAFQRFRGGFGLEVDSLVGELDRVSFSSKLRIVMRMYHTH